MIHIAGLQKQRIFAGAAKIAAMKESAFLNWLMASAGTHPHVTVPIGDDMAAVKLPHPGAVPVLLKIDQCLDRIHFDLRMHTTMEIGRKAVNRCLSDCAAMAAWPSAVLIAVALPEKAEMRLAQGLFRGCKSAASRFDCALVGGDTAIWDQRLAITVAAMGYANADPILRSGAQIGDAIFVSGRLGGSLLRHHLSFVPRIELAQQLLAVGKVHAMMDLSDGLAIDLPRLLQRSNVGAVIAAGQVPIARDAIRLSRRDGICPLSHALCDGEDYELLFTVAPDDSKKFEACALPIVRIGTITQHAGRVQLERDGRRIPWPRGGWNYGANAPPAAVRRRRAKMRIKRGKVRRRADG